jgi:hypothetical protein
LCPIRSGVPDRFKPLDGRGARRPLDGNSAERRPGAAEKPAIYDPRVACNETIEHEAEDVPLPSGDGNPAYGRLSKVT